jgi:hypothetical protein
VKADATSDEETIVSEDSFASASLIGGRLRFTLEEVEGRSHETQTH